MSEKILNARFAQKIDTLERWGQSSIVLKNGEKATSNVKKQIKYKTKFT